MDDKKITHEDLIHWFSYHPPGPDLPGVYQEIRFAGSDFAQVILKYTPPGEDQRRAIETVRDAVMRANQALACATGPEQLAVVERYREG